ncbi:hypothetical protein DSO57_1022220 [Entomophthora muscae]|uniref:Uncharacterized protein n=1 Tax=Entomophthora muscae TaxID=34485 RepID=A0ACC2U1R1_9FUNG|nr:hypothetical protein DSO57_1022220 [Entomophthora muscae]
MIMRITLQHQPLMPSHHSFHPISTTSVPLSPTTANVLMYLLLASISSPLGMMVPPNPSRNFYGHTSCRWSSAHFLSQESATPSELGAKIVSLSNKDAIVTLVPGSPNLCLQ